ncbi:HIV Tat-specific factor 1 homolog [Ctenocephalides felis]|uniref:HIV Tat-specific factor 1 homolog n=1 Tax=Ctenocephalides felis TaxID=7515 RepID=UPI000E6E4906|nr:HIV Tat-specific factor 1 homolog [Ctenocephalides felis]
MFISQTQMAKLALLICLFGIQTGAASKKHFKYAIDDLKCPGYNEVYTECYGPCDTTCNDIYDLQKITKCRFNHSPTIVSSEEEESYEDQSQEDDDTDHHSSSQEFDKWSDEEEEDDDDDHDDESSEEKETEEDSKENLCQEGCICKKGTARDSSGICVPFVTCDRKFFNVALGQRSFDDGEEFVGQIGRDIQNAQQPESIGKHEEYEEEIVALDCDDNDETKCKTRKIPEEIQELVRKRPDLILPILGITTSTDSQEESLDYWNKNVNDSKIWQYQQEEDNSDGHITSSGNVFWYRS